MNSGKKPRCRPEGNVIKTIPLLAALLIFTLVFIGLYWGPSTYIWAAWTTDIYWQHGLVATPLLLYVLWRDRGQWIQNRVDGGVSAWWGLLVLAGAMWIFAWGLDFKPGELLAYFLLLLSGYCIVLGPTGFKNFGLTFSVLLFSIPVWSNIAYFLQMTSALMSGQMLQLAGYTILVEGTLITIPAGIFSVDESCSGLGSLVASLSLVGCLAAWFRQPVRAVLLPLVVAVSLAMLANWIRITIIIASAYESGMDHPLVGDHGTLGTIVWYAIIIPAALLYMRWMTRKPSPMEDQSFLKDTSASLPVLSTTRPTMLCLAAVLIATTPGFYTAGMSAVNRSTSTDDELMTWLDGLDDSHITESPWHPEILGVDQIWRKRVSILEPSSSQAVDIFKARYSEQPYQDQIINHASALIPTAWSRGKRQSSSTAYFLDQVVYNPDGQPYYLRYWFEIGPSPIVDRISAKLLRLPNKLSGRLDTSITALLASCDSTACNDGAAAISQVYQTLSSNKTLD